jgi:hypothetical protein
MRCQTWTYRHESYPAAFTVAAPPARARDAAFREAGKHVVNVDGPHEHEWSPCATIRLDHGQELKTILHHRAGKPPAHNR